MVLVTFMHLRPVQFFNNGKEVLLGGWKLAGIRQCEPGPWHSCDAISSANVGAWMAAAPEAPTSTSEHVGGPFWAASHGGDSKVAYRRRVCEEGELAEAVQSLELLVQQGSGVDSSLLYTVLKKCAAKKNLDFGKRVHALAITSGYEANTFLANHFIRMYASHGKLEEAMQVFTNASTQNNYVWASIISAHAEHGQPIQAISLYRQMLQSTVKPNSYVFVATLKACTSAVDLASGREIHGEILRTMLEPDKFIGSCLVDMYAKCGSLGDARKVFDALSVKNVVSWTAMIAAYAKRGLGQEALALYASMQQQHDSIPANHVTFVCLLQACASVGALQQGKQLHAQIQQRGLEADLVVGNCLVNMYAKCGSLEEARDIFDRLPTRDVVTWTAMIGGYAQHGLGQEALNLYASMQEDGMSIADGFTFACLLKACTNLAAVHQGKQLHGQIQQRGLETDMVVGSCLVDMYAKCGSLEDARKVFDKLPTRDVVTWTALLNGYAEHSNGQMAIKCFEEMRQQGVKPDRDTFACLLVACNHEGLVDEGRRYFQMMVDECGLAPDVYHYNCMVDLLGRAGRLGEAENVLQSMPFETDVVGWKSLLSSCKIHGDTERARLCFDRLRELEPENSTAYVLMSSAYADAGRWNDAYEIECLRKSAGARKKGAKASIEVNRKVHEFAVGEDWGDDVSSKSRNMNSRFKEEGGHVPHTELVLKALPDSKKEDALCGHAEKLALAYGLLNTADGTTLVVNKNLRMCNDCHSSTKIMSHIEKREIIVRDASRVHRFVDGSCSCGDRH